MAITMTLNGYSFSPVPKITIKQNHNRVKSGRFIGRTVSATLSGDLLASSGDCPPSLYNIIELEEELRNSMISCSGCPILEITCDSNIVFSVPVRVLEVNINESSDNWIFSAPYTIALEWDRIANSGEEECDSCLKEISESWSFQPTEPMSYNSSCGNSTTKYYNVSHNLAASAVDCCIDGVIHSGWEIAKDWVSERMGSMQPLYLGEFSGIDPAFNEEMFFYDHNRQISHDPYSGSFSIQETWVGIIGSGVDYIEDINIEESFNRENRFKTYSISGNIKGLETRNPDYTVASTKIENALARWEYIEMSGLHTKIECLYPDICNLHPIPISSSIGRNFNSGVINFNFTYDQRPSVLVSGAQYESIQFSDVKPAQEIAEIPIIGRKAGPILINTGRTNKLQRSIQINVVMPYVCESGSMALCDRIGRFDNQELAVEAAMNSLLCCVQTRLENGYDQVYRVNDSMNFDWINGSYNRDTTWVFQKCAEPVLDICDGTGYVSE